MVIPVGDTAVIVWFVFIPEQPVPRTPQMVIVFPTAIVSGNGVFASVSTIGFVAVAEAIVMCGGPMATGPAARSDPVTTVKGTQPADAGHSRSCKLLFAPGHVATPWQPPVVGMLQLVTRKSIQYDPCVPGEVSDANGPPLGNACVADADTSEIDCPAP
jgi:hypothetical protein